MLRTSHLALVIALSAGMGGIASAEAASPPPSPPGSPTSTPGSADRSADATIKNADGQTVGSLRMETRNNGRVRLIANVRDLPPGYHGFHIHAVGVCDPKSTDPATGSPFFSAGGHFNLDSGDHPNHTGDLSSLLVGANGAGRVAVTTDRFQVKQLLDKDGSAIVIHALPDNFARIPDRYSAEDDEGPDADTLKTGDSGGRIACGVITGR